MKINNFIYFLGLASAMAFSLPASFAAGTSATSTEKAFIMKAANGGMTEVELGKIASEKGGSEGVKDFGKKMVTDHSKANENLKEVAAKMDVTVPASVDARHQAKIDKMSAMSGEAFDHAYIAGMIKAHKMDIADFEAADKEVKNPDLKHFIEETVPVMKGHLSMIEKMGHAKE